MEVSREAFESADAETKLLLIYDILSSHRQLLIDYKEKLNVTII